jgi:hypothetical protein
VQEGDGEAGSRQRYTEHEEEWRSSPVEVAVAKAL